MLSPTACELEKVFRPSFTPARALALPPSSLTLFLSFKGCQSLERKRQKSREGKVLFLWSLSELDSAHGALQRVGLTLGVLRPCFQLSRCGHMPSPCGRSPVNRRLSRATQTLCLLFLEFTRPHNGDDVLCLVRHLGRPGPRVDHRKHTCVLYKLWGPGPSCSSLAGSSPFLALLDFPGGSQLRLGHYVLTYWRHM